MFNKDFQCKVSYKRILADTITPVGAYLSLRDKFPRSLLLESADYRGSENSRSFIGVNPIAEFSVRDETIIFSGPTREKKECEITNSEQVLDSLKLFFNSFKFEQPPEIATVGNGFFGYCCYDSVKYFEDIKITKAPAAGREIPLIQYTVFEYVIAFHHFNNELYILHNQIDGNTENSERFNYLRQILEERCSGSNAFSAEGSEQENMSDQENIAIINKCKDNIARGDVFQIVPSRCFSQKFKGDDFQVYRALRAINPSPYLFYFDYGNYRIFGSSPEAQIIVENGQASIFPIAGTYRRSADRADDRQLADTLRIDPKENAEHVMLVDLARNDLSKHCRNVNVDVFKEVQFYSHVIHLVSKVSGTVRKDATSIGILADTFPAGTLSGAPKYRAMQLIDQYEPHARGFYGGCLGIVSPQGNINHAIMIRSFHSQNQTLHYQAGAGIVYDSDPKLEVQEIRNKLGALRRAIEIASKEYL